MYLSAVTIKIQANAAHKELPADLSDSHHCLPSKEVKQVTANYHMQVCSGRPAVCSFTLLPLSWYDKDNTAENIKE